MQDAARACCEDAVCLKKRLWDVDDKTPLAMDRGEGEIPCPEPCSLFVSFARRVRLFERERDAEDLSPSEREDLVALVEAAASGEVRFAREAEFEEPLNERRMRYRRLTLVRINVSSCSFVLTLHGVISGAEERKGIEAAVRVVPGVRDVVNKLNVTLVSIPRGAVSERDFRGI